MKSLFQKIGFGKKEERKFAGSDNNVPMSSPTLPEEAIFKMVLAGPEATGKSSLLNKYSDDLFDENYIQTIGVDFKTKKLQERNKQSRLVTIKQQIWDLAGQERFRSVTNAYFRGADIIILVFSLTDRNSLLCLVNLFKEYQELTRSDAPFLLVGTKADDKEKREASFLEGRDFADENGIENYIEVSSKTGQNVEEVFHQANLLIMKNRKWL